jgi:hypothetical protein
MLEACEAFDKDHPTTHLSLANKELLSEANEVISQYIQTMCLSPRVSH